MAHRLSPQVLSLAALAAVLAVASALIGFGVAGAEAGETRAVTFSGSCEMTGVIRHEPPMTNQPAPTQVRGRFDGTCSGRFTNGRGRTHRIKNATGSYRARPAGDLSCLGGTATGMGRLIIRPRRSGIRHVIDVDLTERRTLGAAEVTLRGAHGGSGIVTGTVSPEELAKAAQRCSGAGLRNLRGAASITTSGLKG